ncbi:MAG: PhoX family phosphatase [Gammaproteobacteria bacterium]|nr:PhoX family phosphatase [Gammaproteobacteria bacterium]
MSNSHNDDHPSNPRQSDNGASFGQVCERRYSRRQLLKVGAIAGASATLGSLAACGERVGKGQGLEGRESPDRTLHRSNFDFIEIEHGRDQTHHVAPDHEARILLRWGDPIFRDAPEFDINRQTATAQAQQFGYNNDYIGFLQLSLQDDQTQRALLCINHEYPTHGLMFPGLSKDERANITEEQIKISQAACGASIIEVVHIDGEWQVNRNSKYNRRITSSATEMQISGPVAGHPRLQTTADSSGRKVFGTLNNCAGGMTPWGTFLSCEENFNYHISGQMPEKHPEGDNYRRYNLPSDYFSWGKYDKRFDISVEPNEANRFGWVVEIDPLDPDSTPVKRTALGRFKHEGGENIIASDGRLVIYMGDDQQFEYLYKFVSQDKVNLENPKANLNLLDRGILYAARFHEDGSLDWLPLEIGNASLDKHFASQADILIEPRRAADLLGATPLDRPEDVVPNHQTGRVYVMLTNNLKRFRGNAANPRAGNLFGHIIEISELDDNHSATRGTWNILVKCGDPGNFLHRAEWNDATTENGWFASPDNAAIDPAGRLWVASDQGSKAYLSGTNDGLWALETEGRRRATGKMFFRVPIGAEMCGPVFSDDGESLFLAVQHPGVIEGRPGTARFATATTRWPDFREDMPPRPSIVAVHRINGGKVG